MAGDLTGWRSRRATCGGEPLIVLAGGGLRPDVERFAREQGVAVVSPPYHLRALRAALGAAIKEYV
jgi:hypothetical protein